MVTLNNATESASIESDVLVIGGGPAGSTAAALLAEHGHDVVLLEKSHFPRYHVGESLMPYCWFALERLGVLDQMDAIGFQRKHSVQFAGMDGRVSTPFYFFQHWDHPAAVTWQVERAELDEMLLNNARNKGARVFEGHRATSIEMDGDRVAGVRALGPDGIERSYRSSITIDATGRDALAQSKLGWRVRDPELNKVAVWAYYKNGARDPGLDAGSTTIAYLPDKGWFWYIPLRDNRVSVGIVAERDYLFRNSKDPASIMAEEIPNNAWVAEHLKEAECEGEFWVTGEYSYRAKHCAKNGLVLAGDAFAFLDPVFSSGVFLALKSGQLAADAVHAALEQNDVSAGQFADYGETLCGGIETMRKLVYAFYNPEFSFKDLVMQYPESRGALTDRLIGDLFSDSEALFEALANFSALPAPLPHGRPPLDAVVCASSN